MSGATGRSSPSLTMGEAFHSRLFASLADPFVIVDMRGVIREFNEGYRVMVGYTTEELRGMNYRAITPRKWHAVEDRIVRTQIQKQGHSAVYEKEYRRKDGTVFPIELRAFLIRNPRGVAEGMWAIVRDVSERKRERDRLEATLAKLRDANQRLQFQFERMPLAFIVWDREMRAMEWNPAAARIFGWSAEEAIGRHVRDLVVPEAIAQVESLWQDVVVHASGERFNVNDNLTRDGRRITCEWFNAPLRDGTGAVIGCMSMARDITRRLKAEEEILALNAGLERRVASRTQALTDSVRALEREARRRRHAEKALLMRQQQLVALVSQLTVAESAERRRIADGLHDDVTQMLAAAKLVSGDIGLAVDPSIRKRVRELDEMIDHVLVATRSLIFDLASPVLQRLGLVAALEDLAERFSRSGHLAVAFKSNVRECHADAEVRDFVFRATQEMLRNVVRHAAATRAQVALRQTGGALEVTVEDDGVGPDAIKKSRFSPSGGFGLHVVRERVHYLGGWVRVRKLKPAGTRMTFRVPLFVKRSEPADGAGPTAPT